MATTHLGDVDPVMRTTIERVGLCTLQPNPDIFCALIDTIVSQQISVRAADAIMARIRAALPGGTVTPEALQSFDVDSFRTLGLSMQKARYIRNLMEHINSGQLQLERLSVLDDPEIIQQLTVVKGIGQWSAEMCLIFVFARPDVFPADDLGVLEGIRGAYQLPTRPTRQEARARSELWRPYRTYATWYLWGYRRLMMQEQRARTRIVSL